MTSNRPSRSWRIVDIVIASVLAVACGAVFVGWNVVSLGPTQLLTPVLPGLQGLVNGPWLLAGPLAGLVIRKPGAALYAEFVAAAVELVVYPQYGASTLLSGFTQGLGAELGFALLAYRRFGWGAGLVAGALAGLGEAPTDLLVAYRGTTPEFAFVYAASTVLSGAIIGLVAWAVVRALATTGALDRFAAGGAGRRAV